MPKINAEMQAANRAFGTRIAKSVLRDLRKEYPGMAAHARFAKPRQVQVSKLSNSTRHNPKAFGCVSYLAEPQSSRHCCAIVVLGRP